MGGQLRFNFESEACFARDRFIVAPSNVEAAALIDRWPAGASGSLALIGPEGSGKTHLAQSWRTRMDAVVLTRHALDSDSPRSPAPMLLEDADQIVADEALFHLLNQAALAGACLLMTARSAPALWPTALPDLRSRLNAVPVVELGPPDDAVLQGVLVKLFEERYIRPPADLLSYLVRRIERSATAAAAIVQALDETAQDERRPVSRAMARRLLRDDAESEDAPSVGGAHGEWRGG